MCLTHLTWGMDALIPRKGALGNESEQMDVAFIVCLREPILFSLNQAVHVAGELQFNHDMTGENPANNIFNFSQNESLTVVLG
jgi:hypothetical protein